MSGWDGVWDGYYIIVDFRVFRILNYGGIVNGGWIVSYGWIVDYGGIVYCVFNDYVFNIIVYGVGSGVRGKYLIEWF